MYSLNKTKYLLDIELKALSSLIERRTDRDATLLWVLLKSGGRAQEILNITTEDLNPQGNTIFIRGLKNSKDREIPLPQKLFRRLQLLAPASGRIFPITYDRLYQIWLEWRPVKKKLHSLRHTFAIEVYKKTKDLKLVQTALGHKSITNTMIYSDFLFTQEQMRRIL